MLRGILRALLLVPVLAGTMLVVAPADAGVTDMACFGAASRNPAVPCTNPALRRLVVPRPAYARAVPRSDCRARYASRDLFVCGWRVGPERPARTLALIGDSHAAHWRPAVERLAEHERWGAVSMSLAGCPFTRASIRLPTAARTAGCRRWNRAVRSWLGRHPEVSVIVVSQHAAAAVPTHGRSAAETARRGYASAWRTVLRRNVRHVIVLRDSPRNRPTTLACVSRSLRAGGEPGPACAVPRSYAVRPDRAVDAARALDDRRVQVVDLTRVFCDRRACPPVIGGALVHRDTSHLTRQFVATLGPFLAAAVDRLQRDWTG